MATDPYVPSKLENQSRQLPNLAPGVAVPPAQRWQADRPGEFDPTASSGRLMGSPGPNIGYAVTLANRAASRVNLADHEHLEDALAVIAAIAMRRASMIGRAPVMPDIDFAIVLLGYDTPAKADLFEWRREVVSHAGHEYIVRRGIVDAIPSELLRLSPAELPERVAAFRSALRGSRPPA
jgi:hypothetical protein